MNTMNALHVAHNDEHHDYNKSDFVCHIENRRDAVLIAHSQEAVDIVRALSIVLDDLPGEAAQRLHFTASEFLKKINTARNSGRLE